MAKAENTSDWASILQDLPDTHWDFLTDLPRSGSRDVHVLEVPLRVEEDVGEVGDLDVLVALAAALGQYGHGRPVVWIMDCALRSPAPIPLQIALEDADSSLDRLHCAVTAKRAGLGALWDSDPDKALRTLQSAAPPKRFAAQRAHTICQVAFGFDPHAGQHTFLRDEAAPDFAVSPGKARSLFYRGDLYKKETAELLAKHVQKLLRERPNWSSITLASLNVHIQDDAERELTVRGWSGPSEPFPDCGIHELFESVARGSLKDSPAILPAEDDPPWSYRDLDVAAQEVSNALQPIARAELNGRVALMAHRSPRLVAGIYGILRAGHAYVPVDPLWPTNRQCFILEDVRALALVLDEGLQKPTDSLPAIWLRTLTLPSATGHLAAVVDGVGSRYTKPQIIELGAEEPDVVYIFYTSGTTGKPKGVVVPHSGLVGRTAWLQRTWPLVPSDVMVQKASFTFGISEWELFWPLCYGAQLALVADGLHGDAREVLQTMEKRKVTHSVFVPSLLELLLEELEPSSLQQLRLVIACGEALRPATVCATCAKLKAAELANIYGPTEGSITVNRIRGGPKEEDLLRFPIGVPIDNTTILCSSLSNDLAGKFDPSPIHAKGEIGFAGPLIAIGYWNLPELSLEKFVPNPHGAGKVYRSGDLGRWRADATLEFLGRMDNQVKFNGVRIELGELESALSSIVGVTSCAAFLSLPHLVMVCTLADAGTNHSAEHSHLMEELRRRLPKYYMPTRLEILESLPVTDRGKIDRKKLVEEFPQGELERAKAAQQGVESLEKSAMSETERVVEAKLRELLGQETPLPVTISFQDLGFSSLQLGKLTAYCRRHFAVMGLAATAVYLFPTVRQLAKEIDSLRDTKLSAGVSDGLPLIPATTIWRGQSATSMTSILCTLLGVLGQSTLSEFAFLPAYFTLFVIYFESELWVLFLLLPIILFADHMLTVAIFIALKWLVVGKYQPGNYPIFGWYYWKWWFINRLQHYIEVHVASFFSDTIFYSWYLRALGAEVGDNVRMNQVHIGDTDLISFGSDVRVEREATISPSRFWCGELLLRRIEIGQGALIQARSFVPAGTNVPAKTTLVPMASMDKSGAFHTQPAGAHSWRPTNTLTLLQLFLGFPILLIVEGLSYVPVVYAMISLWSTLEGALYDESLETETDTTTARRLQRGNRRGNQGDRGRRRGVFGQVRGYTLGGSQNVLSAFCMLLPWIFTFVHGFAYFALVVLVKWLLVGRFRPGPVSGDWAIFKRWLIERLTTNHAFDEFMGLWVNTEFLAMLYRLLGAHISPRVNMDYFGVVEFDLITIKRDVVFGSSVLLVPTSQGVSSPILIMKGACVLDHSCVMPGTVIPEGTLLGSFTVVPPGHKLSAMTVYTGCVNGAPVQLFQRPLQSGRRVEGDRVVKQLTAEPSPGPPSTNLSDSVRRQLALEARAYRRHKSCLWLTMFNLWCVFNAFIFAPLPDCCYWVTILIDFEIYDAFEESGLGEVVSILLLGPLHPLTVLIQLVLITLLKWLLIGCWKPGEHPFYSWFHFRWAALMTAFASLEDAIAEIQGTWLVLFYMRCMGGKVGKDVAFFGHGFEYDLLSIEDQVCIGMDCDVTAHTVENMVMKLERVKFGRGSTCMDGSLVMPGGQMEPHSTLIEHSQVMKGETVPENACFGGLPAKFIPEYPHTRSRNELSPGAAGAQTLGRPLAVKQTVVVTLPPSTVPGSTIQVQASSGQIIQVQVPQDAAPGQELRVQC